MSLVFIGKKALRDFSCTEVSRAKDQNAEQKKRQHCFVDQVPAHIHITVGSGPESPVENTKERAEGPSRRLQPDAATGRESAGAER